MKLLIVDDEPRHRRGMANMIQALRPKHQVLVAKDGASALEFVRVEQPDIVLTDIRMPNMDGLTFLKMLEAESLRTKVVMVSAYNLFEYAQTAMRHGAYDYLLKPVEAEKVEAVLSRIEQQLVAESRLQSESEALKHRLRLTSSAYRNRLLLSWLHGSLTAMELKEVETWIHGSGMVIGSEFRIGAGIQAGFDAANLLQHLEQAWSAFGEATALSVHALQEDVIQAVTLIRTSRLVQESAFEIRQVASSLGAVWATYGRLTHGIGPDCQSLMTDAPQSYRSAQAANLYNFHECWNGVTFHHELIPSRMPIELDDENLFEALQGRDAGAAIEMCRAAFVRFAAKGHAHPAQLKECAALTLMKLKSRMHNYVDRQIGSVLTEAALQAVPSCCSYSELMLLLEARLWDVNDALRHVQQDRTEIIVAECLRWIQENFKDDLTLEKAAEHFYFNASYFSTLIRSRTGKAFSDHMMEARMQRAKELLAENKLKIYEIAAACGYQDTKYFCRVFKKQNGISPETYKHTSFPQRSREG